MPPRPRAPRPRLGATRRPRVAGLTPAAQRTDGAERTGRVRLDEAGPTAFGEDPLAEPEESGRSPAPSAGQSPAQVPAEEPAEVTMRMPVVPSPVPRAEPLEPPAESTVEAQADPPATPPAEAPAEGAVAAQVNAPDRSGPSRRPSSRPATGTRESAPAPDASPRDDTAADDTPADDTTGDDTPAAERRRPARRQRPRRDAGADTPEPARESRPEPAVADDEPQPGRHGFLAVLRVRAVPLLACAFVLLTAAAVAFGVLGSRLYDTPSAANSALVDVGATAEVAGQLSDALETVYSFDYTRLDENERAARDVITPEFGAEFDRLFGQVREQAPQQQAVVSATVTLSAVKEITGDHAVMVVFVDQQATRAAADPQSQQLAAAGRLTVVGERVDGRWKIASVIPR